MPVRARALSLVAIPQNINAGQIGFHPVLRYSDRGNIREKP